MTEGPLSGPVDGSTREPPAPVGGVLPGVDPRPAAVESSTDTPDTTSWSQLRRRAPDEHRASTEQRVGTDRQVQAEHPEHDHADLADTPAPSFGGDSTVETGSADSLASETDRPRVRWNPLAILKHGVVEAVTFVAFLAAVSLPFLYLPLLLLGGLDGARSTGFFVLVGLHVVSLAIGYRYEPRKPFGGD